MRLAGRAMMDGFVIIGDVDTNELADSAREALQRLQSGESSLAVSPLCGTNIVVGAFLSALAATLILASGSLRSRWSNAFMAAMIGAVAGQPAGRWVQAHITTLADHEDVELVATRSVFGHMHKVQTREAGV